MALRDIKTDRYTAISGAGDETIVEVGDRHRNNGYLLPRHQSKWFLSGCYGVQICNSDLK